MGTEAQIKSSHILAEQREELEVMREAISALLKHNLKQSKQQAEALKGQDKIESERRYRENTRLSKVAAGAGVFGTLLASVGIALQITSQWKS
jgi:type VI protein secretion system component VasF